MSCGDLMMRGHSIEVRLYAEDATNNFLPAIGPLAVFRAPTGPGIRLDTGVREGDMVTPNYDPMLAKLIVWAPSRRKHWNVCAGLWTSLFIGRQPTFDFA